ncbi:hypothetical protein [Geodermatophilus sp. CPCC 205761]|uniref:hypothetical protein n=1 Tax=Geodermatophilus sp. CPCC 205761 TaxID=2936597 RepID=UPI003F52A030
MAVLDAGLLLLVDHLPVHGPLALFRALQDDLTAVDLGIDASIRHKYTLLKMLTWSATDADTLARWAGLEYDPNPRVSPRDINASCSSDHRRRGCKV